MSALTRKVSELESSLFALLTQAVDKTDEPRQLPGYTIIQVRDEIYYKAKESLTAALGEDRVKEVVRP